MVFNFSTLCNINSQMSFTDFFGNRYERNLDFVLLFHAKM